MTHGHRGDRYSRDALELYELPEKKGVAEKQETRRSSGTNLGIIFHDAPLHVLA